MAFSTQTGDPATSGSSILAADFNNLLDLFTQVWGNPGYGQRIDISRRLGRSVNETLINSDTQVSGVGAGYIILNGHGLQDGDIVLYKNNGNESLGDLISDAYYYVKRTSDNIFGLSTDPTLATLTTIDQTSGNHIIGIVTSDVIGHTEWSELGELIETCYKHQNGDNATLDLRLPVAGDIVSTQNDPGFTFGGGGSNIKNSVNEWYNAINGLINNLTTTSTDSLTLDFTNADQGDFTRDQWGGRKDLGFAQSISHTFPVNFPGGYLTTNVGGANVVATSADHRRHFFNAGGKIVFQLEITGGIDSKTVNWAQVLSGLGTVYFGKSSTTSTANGVTANGSSDLDENGVPDSAVGNDQLSASPKLIAFKRGSGVYDENRAEIFAWLQGTNIVFEILLSDADQGDQRAANDPGLWVDKDSRVAYPGWQFGPQFGPDSRTPAGPGEDEFVLGSGGTLRSNIYTAYSTEYAPVLKPSYSASISSF